MNIAPLNPPSRASGEIPVEKLASHKGLTEQEKIAEASRQFEAVLLRQILHDARKPVFKSTLTEKSATNAIYDDLVTAQLADAISRGGEFGLARSLATQLKPAESRSDSDTNRTPNTPSSPS
jgi:Rod binding domain-containing protein